MAEKKQENNSLSWGSFPPCLTHTCTHVHAYMLQMKKMFEMEANYSGWHRARILVIGFSLFPPQFLFLSLLSSLPNHQVGGWVAGWLLVGKQK